MAIKDKALKLLKEMPKTSTWDDVMYELYFLMNIDKALNDVSAGRICDHASVVKDSKKWLK